MSKVDAGKDFIEHLDFGTKQRKTLADKGQAMSNGSFPIRNTADLKRAIQAYGRARNKVKAKAWIIKRAKELDALNLLPMAWRAAEQSNVEKAKAFLEHYGVKGMRWGVRRSRRQLRRAAKSRDSDRLKNMSDDELRTMVNRMNLEQQYSRLSSGSGSGRNKGLIAAGSSFAGGIALNVARTQIQNALTRQVGAALAGGGRDGAVIRTASAVSAIGRTERR